MSLFRLPHWKPACQPCFQCSNFLISTILILWDYLACIDWKKTPHNLKILNSVIIGEISVVLSPEYSLSDCSEGLLWSKWGANIYRSFATKVRKPEHQKIAVNQWKPNISSYWIYWFFMYGSMQESGLIESILLIYILAMWNQRPLLFHSESLGIASLGVAAVAEGLSFYK